MRIKIVKKKKKYYEIISIIIKNIGIATGVRQKVCGKIDNTVFVYRLKRYGMPVLRLFILKRIKDNISDQSIALDNNFRKNRSSIEYLLLTRYRCSLC